MKKLFKTIVAASVIALMAASCAGDSVVYKGLVYEATSDPSVNMAVRMRFPGKESLYGTSGSYLKQNCGYVPENFEAEITADVIHETGTLSEDAQVTVRIYLDGACVAESSNLNSASAKLSSKTE